MRQPGTRTPFTEPSASQLVVVFEELALNNCWQCHSGAYKRMRTPMARWSEPLFAAIDDRVRPRCGNVVARVAGNASRAITHDIHWLTIEHLG